MKKHHASFREDLIGLSILIIYSLICISVAFFLGFWTAIKLTSC